MCDRIPGKVVKGCKLLLTLCFVAIMLSSNISNIILVAETLQQLLRVENSDEYVILAIFLLISVLLCKIAETEKISFVFYISICCLLFLQSSMFLDNLRLIWENGNIMKNIRKSLWKRPESEGYGVYIGILAYAFEMADCYLASKWTFDAFRYLGIACLI